VFASDFSEDLFTHETPQRSADRILAKHCKGNDDALIFIARFLGDPNEVGRRHRTKTRHLLGKLFVRAGLLLDRQDESVLRQAYELAGKL